jgi:TrmH family RNA methyltransferase
MIESRSNETLKAIRRLRRRQGDHALLEGPHLVGAALDAGLDLETVLVTAPFEGSVPGSELLRRLRRAPRRVAAELLDELADADSPRGVVALARLPRGGAEALPARSDGLFVYLDGVQDPGNVGAVARVAEAFGAAGLALSPGCAHPNHPRALRASAGSLLRLSVGIDVTIDALDLRFAPRRPSWAVLAAHGGRGPESGVARPLVVALGAEGPGLSAAALARADRLWTLPLAAPVESLNVAVTAGIVLHSLAAI